MKAIDINSIPYTHRFSGASLLIGKANRLSGLSGVQAQPAEPRALIAAVAQYKLALLLLKPYDPNYSTVANWLCLALVSLKQYGEAIEWYQQIVEISDKVDGGSARNATAALALEMIGKYSGLANEPLPALIAGNDSFDEPPYCMHAEEFCSLLAERKFKIAYRYLAPQLQQSISLAKLKDDWLKMVGKARAEDTEIVLQQHTVEWPTRKENEVAWCYLSVAGQDFNEAATLVVARTPSKGYWITELEFGRP